MDVLSLLGVLVAAAVVLLILWAVGLMFLLTTGKFIVFLVTMFLPVVVGIPLGLIWYFTVNQTLGNMTVLAAIAGQVFWIWHFRNAKIGCKGPIHQLSAFGDWYDKKF